jgi:transposase
MDTMLPPVLTDAEATHTIDRKSARGAAMEVIVRGERRRNWTTEQKCQIVAESLGPGLTPSDVARRHGIGTGLLYTWRRQMLTGATGTLTRSSPSFTQVELSGPSGQEIVAEPLEAPPSTPVEPSRLEGLIEIMLPGGVSLRVDAQVDSQALRRVLGALADR